MTKKCSKKKGERGVVLIVALIVTTSLLIMILPFLFKLSSQYKNANRPFDSLSAIYLAEGGIEMAIWEFNHGDISSWTGDSDLRTMTISSIQTAGGTTVGDIEIRVLDPEGETPIIEATGIIPYSGIQTIEKTIRVVLSRENVPWDYGIFGNDGVNVNAWATVDSYDSREGVYGGDNQGEEGHMGTNATANNSIRITAGSQVYGDACSGFESDPEDAIFVSPISTLHGEKLALSSAKELHSVLPPSDLDFLGDYSVSNWDSVIISESGEYTNFTLGLGSEVTITSDVTLYITGQFHMGNFSDLNIAEGASVTIYLGGSFSQGIFNEINNFNQDPTQLLILGTDDFDGHMSISVVSDFYGAIYAPMADVSCMWWGNLFGSLVAEEISLSVASNIHYDKAFEDFKIPCGSGSPYTIKSWQEIIRN